MSAIINDQILARFLLVLTISYSLSSFTFIQNVNVSFLKENN